MRYRIPWYCVLNVWLESIAYLSKVPNCTMPCNPVTTHEEVAELGHQWLELMSTQRDMIGRPLSPRE